jgi:hypothetical protein
MQVLKQAEFYQKILRPLITFILIPLSMTRQSATWRVGSSGYLPDQAPELVTSFIPNFGMSYKNLFNEVYIVSNS